jgi:hypothetical protein
MFHLSLEAGVNSVNSPLTFGASEEALNRMREDTAEAMNDTIAGVGRYSVWFFEMSS